VREGRRPASIAGLFLTVEAVVADKGRTLPLPGGGTGMNF
jgi:hypothetical protein